MKVISGGQDGVDVAALRAAKKLGYETGGYMPRGCRTKHGADEHRLMYFGLTEHKSPYYPLRTFANVKASDGTIRIAMNFNTPGERKTIQAVQFYNRPWFDVKMDLLVLDTGPMWTFDKAAIEVADWVVDNDIEILNIAGNAMQAIESHVAEFVELMLRQVMSVEVQRELFLRP